MRSNKVARKRLTESKDTTAIVAIATVDFGVCVLFVLLTEGEED